MKPMFLNAKNIFLLDGVGAILSLALTGFILPLFSDLFGLPASLLYKLALFPLAYCIYSFCCYWYFKKIKPWMLMAIILANAFYCVVSGVLLFTFEGISFWGKMLLISEIAVVLAVIAIELSVYKKTFCN